MTLALYIGAICSSLFRVSTYVFLRVVGFSSFRFVCSDKYTLQIPVRWCKYLVPGLYLAYLATIPFASRSPPPTVEKEDRPNSDAAKDDEPPTRTNEACLLLRLPRIVLTTFPQSPNKNQDIFWELLFSLPTTRLTSVVTWSINTLLILLAADFVFTPVIDSATDVTFTRIGAVYPDAVKVTVRYPLFEAGATEHHVRVQWRPVTVDAGDRWKDGPILHLRPEFDWTNTTKLTKLWPSTEYECALFYP